MVTHPRSWSILMIMGMGWGLTFSLGRIAAVGGRPSAQHHVLGSGDRRGAPDCSQSHSWASFATMMIALTLVAPRKSQPVATA
jgi:hypothetical protein